MAYAHRRPVWFARGNHDVRGPEARALGRFLDTPGGKFYYSVRQGPVAFLVLDTGEDKADDAPVYAGLGTFDAYRAEQATWLAQELKKDHVRSAPFRVVVAHIPLYTTRDTQPHGGADSRAKWHDAPRARAASTCSSRGTRIVTPGCRQTPHARSGN